LQIAQQDRQTVSLGQPAEFLIEYGQQLALQVQHIPRPRFRYLLERHFASGSPGDCPLELAGRVEGDAMEPLRQQLSCADVCGLLGQDEEHGLKSIIGIGGIAENASADAHHHWPMPSNEDGESVLIALAHEQVHELAVGTIRSREIGNIAESQYLKNGVCHVSPVSDRS
jgi:hypothetical protein